MAGASAAERSQRRLAIVACHVAPLPNHLAEIIDSPLRSVLAQEDCRSELTPWPQPPSPSEFTPWPRSAPPSAASLRRDSSLLFARQQIATSVASAKSSASNCPDSSKSHSNKSSSSSSSSSSSRRDSRLLFSAAAAASLEESASSKGGTRFARAVQKEPAASPCSISSPPHSTALTPHPAPSLSRFDSRTLFSRPQHFTSAGINSVPLSCHSSTPATAERAAQQQGGLVASVKSGKLTPSFRDESVAQHKSQQQHPLGEKQEQHLVRQSGEGGWRERGGGFYASMALPGVPPEAIRATADYDRVTVSWAFSEGLINGDGIVPKQILKGSRGHASWRIPPNVDPSKISAYLENGILLLSLPKGSGP